MTHPLTPREKVRQIIDDALNSAIPEPWEVANHATDRVFAALASGSGDHAELAENLSSPLNACCHRDECKAFLAENAALRAKLAEDDLSAQAEEEEYASKVLEWESVACLRGLRSLELERELSEHRIAADLLVSSLKSDKAEAERKLAEADQVIREISETAQITRVHHLARTFLSKEAERG